MIFGLIRLLLIIGFLYFVYKRLQNYLKNKNLENQKISENDPADQGPIEDMSACPKCGVYVSKNEEHNCQKKDQ